MSFIDLVREPAIRVRTRAGLAIRRSDDGASFVAEIANAAAPAIGAYAPEFETANARLAAGAPLAELRDAVIGSAGGARAGVYLVWLQRLCQWGLLEFALVDEDGERAVLTPQWWSFTPALAPAAPAAEIDRFACLRRDGGAWILESPLVGARVRLDDLAALDAPIVRRALAAAGFLATGRADAAARRDALAQWEFHDLTFHAHNRGGWRRDPIGALFPFIGRIEPLPAARPPWPGERIPLTRAPKGVEPFASVLERRRSERRYDETRPISTDDLGALLDRAARIRWSGVVEARDFAGRSTPFEVTRRPYPNGGASYELEIYPVVDRCDGLASGLYHYDAASHELVRISDRTRDVEQFFTEAAAATGHQAEPQIVLVITARFARVTWKYRSIAYATILRNTGVLYQTLYLAATELGLSPCGLGSGDAALFARATGLDPTIEGTVGDVILGGRPRAA